MGRFGLGGSGAKPPSETINPRDYQERLDRITEIFSDMMQKADEVSTHRCPYKNRFDHCTAKFGCRNQRPATVAGERYLCAADDKLDYRSAWETTER